MFVEFSIEEFYETPSQANFSINKVLLRIVYINTYMLFHALSFCSLAAFTHNSQHYHYNVT